MLDYVILLAVNLGGMAAPQAKSDDSTTAIVRLLDELPSVGGLPMEPPLFRKQAIAMNETMIGLSGYSTESLRNALNEIYARAADAQLLFKGKGTLTAFLGRHQVRSPMRPGESVKQYVYRLQAETRLGRDAEVWVDRFLFEAPEDEPYKEGTPFHQIATGSPRTKLWTRIDRSYPVQRVSDGITMIRVGGYQIDEGGGPGPRPDEFDYYAKHYPRRNKWHFIPPTDTESGGP